MTGHCDEQTLQEFVDGRLSDPASTALRMHLAVCPACASLHRGVMTVDGVLRRIPRDQAGPQMTEAVLARIMLPRRATRLDRMLRPRFLAGAVLVLFGIVGGVGGILTASEQGHGTAMPVWWEWLQGGPLRGIGAQVETMSGLIAGMMPQLFSTDALQVTLAVVLLVPLLLYADHLLAKRRLIG